MLGLKTTTIKRDDYVVITFHICSVGYINTICEICYNLSLIKKFFCYLDFKRLWFGIIQGQTFLWRHIDA